MAWAQQNVDASKKQKWKGFLCMTIAQYNFFIRYLKERGLYTAFLKDARKFPDRRYYAPIKQYLLDDAPQGEEIMRLIHWSSASWCGWSNEYHNYKEFLRKIKNKPKDKIYEIFKSVKKVVI
jgi:hypothetical protein